MKHFGDKYVSHLILAAGRLSPEKGFDVLVDAAKLVVKQHPQAGFLIFGDGVERESLTKQIQDAGLEFRFILAGFTADLDHFLPFVDVVVLPSRTEGLPNVALEASAAGVPVVATAVGGTPEVVEDGVTGFLVPSEDSTLMAERIGKLLNNEEMRRKYGEAGRVKMERDFSFSAQAEKYIQLVESLRPAARVAA